MGTFNASAFNDNHTLLKLILNIKDYLVHNPNVGVYYTLGFQGEVGTTSIPKDKVHGPAGSSNTPSVGDIILYALDIGQGFFQVSGVNNVNYLGEYIGQTIQGPKGDKGAPGVGLNQLTGMSFVHQTATGVTYADGVASFKGQFKLTLSDNTNIFAMGTISLPIVAGNGIIINASEDSNSLIIKVVPSVYTITGRYTHCENSNPATVADEGTAYAATITANSGYSFEDGYTLSVKMGGKAIPPKMVQVRTNTISINIPNVTGDIDINCIAAEAVVP